MLKLRQRGPRRHVFVDDRSFWVDDVDGTPGSVNSRFACRRPAHLLLLRLLRGLNRLRVLREELRPSDEANE